MQEVDDSSSAKHQGLNVSILGPYLGRCCKDVQKPGEVYYYRFLCCFSLTVEVFWCSACQYAAGCATIQARSAPLFSMPRCDAEDQSGLIS